jgi:hypothetical protein
MALNNYLRWRPWLLGVLLGIDLSGCRSQQAVFRASPTVFAAALFVEAPHISSIGFKSAMSPRGRRPVATLSGARSLVDQPSKYCPTVQGRWPQPEAPQARKAPLGRLIGQLNHRFSLATTTFEPGTQLQQMKNASESAASSKTPTQMNAVVLFFLGAVAIAVGGVLVGVSLASWGGVAAALGGLTLGLLALMASVFGITSKGSTAKSRFNAIKLLGWLTMLGGVALGGLLGGLLGAGAGLLVVGLGALLTGVGVVVGIPDEPPTGPK